MIVHQEDGWHVLSEKGRNLGGPYKDRKDAVHRLQVVEYFKRKGKTAEFAPGIPDKSNKEIPRITEPTVMRLAIQSHLADKAGCLPGYARVITNKGLIRIGDIVSKKMKLNVKCMLSSGEIVWRPIINWFINGSTDEWLHSFVSDTRGFITTPSHIVYVQRNKKIKKIKIKDIKEKDSLLSLDIQLNEDLRQFIFGSFLGDASIDCRNRLRPKYRWTQSSQVPSHVAYAKEVQELFDVNSQKSRNDVTIGFSHSFFNILANRYTPKKTVDMDLLKKLDLRGVAAWYMDDGQWSHSKSYFKPLTRNTKRRKNAGTDKFAGQVYLYTNGFTKKENFLIKKWLFKKFKFKFNVRFRNGYFYLVMSGIKNIAHFFKKVSPFIFKSMQYKSPIPVGTYTWKKIDRTKEAVFPVRCTQQILFYAKQGHLKNQKCSTSKYDIEVKEAHNYFTSKILVSNSHYDLRIVDPSNNKAYSFATRHLPTIPGDKTLAKLQPTHTAQYATWEGTIPEGYGAGAVKLFSEDKIELTKADPEHITFNVYKSNGDTDKYALIRTNPSQPDDYLFYNVTPTRQTRPYVPNYKPKYKSTDINAIDVNNPAQYLSTKLDGAATLFVARAGKPLEAYSYRQSRKGANKIIDHTFRTNLYKTIVPKGLKGTTVLRGELYNNDPKLTTPLLLSNVWKSRENQVSAKDPLQATIFDVVQYGGKNYESAPYAEKLQVLKRVNSILPQLKYPTLATTSEEKIKMLELVKSKQHPESKEGVVVYDLNSPVPTKAKLQEDYDVIIKDTFPGQGKYKNMAGGFTYAYPTHPDKIVGRVGTGFTDEERQHMQNYIGQIAKVISQEQLRSGALRAPSFQGIRADIWQK